MSHLKAKRFELLSFADVATTCVHTKRRWGERFGNNLLKSETPRFFYLLSLHFPGALVTPLVLRQTVPNSAHSQKLTYLGANIFIICLSGEPQHGSLDRACCPICISRSVDRLTRYIFLALQETKIRWAFQFLCL